MPMINIDGRNLYFELHGNPDNEPILYLHGGPGDGCMDFFDMAEKISQKYYVICFDQLGSLRSDSIKEDEEFGMDDHLNLIESMRKYLNISLWTILGHGYGGMLACYYANKYPKSIKKVIYYSPSFYFNDSVKSIANYLYNEYFIYSLKEDEGYILCSEIMEKEYKEGDPTSATDVKKLLSYVKDMKVRFYLHNISFDDFQKVYKKYRITDPNDWEKWEVHLQKLINERKMFKNFMPLLIKNTQPSILLVGKYDPCCSLKQRRFYIENAVNGEFFIFSKSGEFAHLEEPEEYCRTIFKFMNK